MNKTRFSKAETRILAQYWKLGTVCEDLPVAGEARSVSCVLLMLNAVR